MTETARQEEEFINNEAREGEVSEKSLRGAEVPGGKEQGEPFRGRLGASWMEPEKMSLQNRHRVVYFGRQKYQKGNSG
jgi:hypothetical protein